ncbi:glycosyltransferase [Anabaena sp. CCY 0017]|uniref:glycosyltransferase n=1 Tax=Anabaena sp. CCY 0017 TaxID=3103866 RepID=UPI0039C6AEF1
MRLAYVTPCDAKNLNTHLNWSGTNSYIIAEALKGQSIHIEVGKKLNIPGLNTELTIVGCQSIIKGYLPNFIKPLGFIQKSTPEGKKKIYQLIANSHFLILPSLANCTPIVFCEANSLGVPCISSKVAGIPTMIKNNLNGKLFDKNSDTTKYCKYI